jgi:hypothetical protein
MNDEFLLFHGLAAGAFGIVMGWVTYRTLRRSSTSGLGDIATVLGAVGGAAVTSLFPTRSVQFSAYCLGLFVGFFLYLGTASDPEAPAWLGGGAKRDRNQVGGPHRREPDPKGDPVERGPAL